MLTPEIGKSYIVNRHGKRIEGVCKSIQKCEARPYLRARTLYHFYDTGTKHNFILKSRVPILREVVKFSQQATA